MGLVTFRFRNTDILHCDSLDNLTFKFNDEKEELEIYKNNEFLGYYAAVYGITEEEFVKYVQDRQIEII